MGEEPRRLDIVVCDKHGLRYNRATDTGCARCKRESGAGVATKGATGSHRAPADPPASLPLQLLFAALLVAGTAALFFAAHQSVLASFTGGILAGVGEAGAEAAAMPAESQTTESLDPLVNPDVIPTPEFDPKGYGPAEQQKQMHELFEQMKEDEEKERGGAPVGAAPPQ